MRPELWLKGSFTDEELAYMISRNEMLIELLEERRAVAGSALISFLLVELSGFKSYQRARSN